MSAPTHDVPNIEYGNMGWVRYEGEDLPTHLVPRCDIRGHALDIRVCPCRPAADDEDPNLIIHNSFDGRERYEYEGAKRH